MPLCISTRRPYQHDPEHLIAKAIIGCAIAVLHCKIYEYIIPALIQCLAVVFVEVAAKAFRKRIARYFRAVCFVTGKPCTQPEIETVIGDIDPYAECRRHAEVVGHIKIFRSAEVDAQRSISLRLRKIVVQLQGVFTDTHLAVARIHDLRRSDLSSSSRRY